MLTLVDDPNHVKNHGNHAKKKVFYFKTEEIDKTRRGSPVDRRPSTAEAAPIGKIHPFSKMAITFEPMIGF